MYIVQYFVITSYRGQRGYPFHLKMAL